MASGAGAEIAEDEQDTLARGVARDHPRLARAAARSGQLRGMAFIRTGLILLMMIAPIAVGLAWRYMTGWPSGP